MISPIPTTPSTGHSRFSKALPTPPPVSSTTHRYEPVNSRIGTASPRTDLPALPIGSNKAPMSIPRRPLAGPVRPVRPVSIASAASSVYSDSPGLSRSLSDSSTKDSSGGVGSEDGPHPPLPPKDKESRSSGSKPQTTPNKSPNTISSLGDSPPRTPIWKRRPQVTDRRVEFPELKLQKSNGSTASPPKQKIQLEARPSLPRSITGRKPVPKRPAPAQPDLMGNKLTKLKTKSSSATASNDDIPAPQPARQQIPPVQRLPTPDYLKADKQENAMPAVLSPASPFTPPDDKPPLIPRKSVSRSHASSDATVIPSNFELAKSNLFEVNNKENLNMPHSRDISQVSTVTSDTTIIAPQPHKPHTTAEILTPQRSPDPEAAVARKRLYFPQVKSPAAPGTVFTSPSLELAHLNCYQNHKIMHTSNNKVYPVSCMVCERKDTEPRWRCSWCSVSACVSCMRVLNTTPEKNLRISLKRIEK